MAITKISVRGAPNTISKISTLEIRRKHPHRNHGLSDRAIHFLHLTQFTPKASGVIWKTLSPMRGNSGSDGTTRCRRHRRPEPLNIIEQKTPAAAAFDSGTHTEIMIIFASCSPLCVPHCPKCGGALYQAVG